MTGRAIPTSLENSVLRPECTIRTETMGWEAGRKRRKRMGHLLSIIYKVYWAGIFLSLSSIPFHRQGPAMWLMLALNSASSLPSAGIIGMRHYT